MSKKRINKEALFLLTSFIMCFAFASFVCMVFPAVKLTYDGLVLDTSIKVDGIIAVFGGKVTVSENTNIDLIETKFNVLSMLGYFLPLLGSIVCYLAFKKKSQFLYFVTAGLCIIGGMLILLEGIIFANVNDLSNIVRVSILFGPIAGGISAILAGIVSLGSIEIFK
jgi:hypothetical protein